MFWVLLCLCMFSWRLFDEYDLYYFQFVCVCIVLDDGCVDFGDVVYWCWYGCYGE